MTAVLTPDEMRRADALSPVPVDVLIRRAGFAVAREAIALLGGCYGRSVVVLAGTGNNGADGRVAADVLRARGARVSVVSVNRRHIPSSVPNCDLVIDAVLGTGFSGSFAAPDVGRIPVLAVDVPSGLDCLTGQVRSSSRVLVAERTVTFAAWKTGMLFADGPSFCGNVVVADIGLPASSRVHLLDDAIARSRLPRRPADAHKWKSGVLVIGGQPGMSGAPWLAARAAQRAGAGMVRLGIPGQVASAGSSEGLEVVGVPMPEDQWGNAAVAFGERCRAVVLGPGLGRSRATLQSVRSALAKVRLPIVLDGDGLTALTNEDGDDARQGARAGLGVLPIPAPTPPPLTAGQRAVLQAQARENVVGTTERVRRIDPSTESAHRALGSRPPASTVLTPHDGEFERITGRPVGSDRIGAVRALAEDTGAVVLLKGPTTIVAGPDGRVELIRKGDQRLATAGSGDVLSGVIGALLAQGLSCFDAAATGAWVHGCAALGAHQHGTVAGDLVGLIPSAWS